MEVRRKPTEHHLGGEGRVRDEGLENPRSNDAPAVKNLELVTLHTSCPRPWLLTSPLRRSLLQKCFHPFRGIFEQQGTGHRLAGDVIG